MRWKRSSTMLQQPSNARRKKLSKSEDARSARREKKSDLAEFAHIACFERIDLRSGRCCLELAADADKGHEAR